MTLKKIALIENSSSDFYFSRMNLSHFLVKKGLEVVAVVPDDGYANEISQEIKTIKVGTSIKGESIWNKIVFLTDLYKILRKENFDLIHCFRLQPNIIGGFISGFLMRTKNISHVTGLGYPFTFNSLKFRILQKIISCFFRFNEKNANTFFIFQNEYDPIDVKIKNYKVIKGSSVNENIFKPKKNIRSKKKTELKLLFVSRLLNSKGLNIVIEAIQRLNNDSHDIKLDVLGSTDYDNPDSISITKLEQWGKMPYITFHGKVSNVVDFIHNADICVLPTSYREGTPRFLLEAMACAKPIITTNTPGCSHCVTNDNGFLLETNNEVESLIKLIVNLNKESLEKMGKRSRILYENEFCEKKVFEQVYSVYSEL